jgi:hypothetical protein
MLADSCSSSVQLAGLCAVGFITLHGHEQDTRLLLLLLRLLLLLMW